MIDILCNQIDFQASPSDPENFPFVVLGNKVDVDGGNSRVVSYLSSHSIITSLHILDYLSVLKECYTLKLMRANLHLVVADYSP